MNAHERVLATMEVVSASTTPVKLEAIANEVGLSRATAYRLIDGLCESGVLLREPKGAGFSPGPRMTGIAVNLMSHEAFRLARHGILQSLAVRLGETCNFTILHDDAVLYVDRVEVEWSARLALKAGSRTPLHCTSSGKLYLSLMPAKERRRLILDSELQQFTSKTITDPKRLESELKTIRKQRVSYDDEGYLDGLTSVAVPVYGSNRVVIGTVSVHGSSARFQLEKTLTVLPELRHAAIAMGDAYRKIEMRKHASKLHARA